MYVREMLTVENKKDYFYKIDLCRNYNTIPITSGSPLVYTDTSILLRNYLQCYYLRMNKYQPVTTH